jgi:hypothetical protein
MDSAGNDGELNMDFTLGMGTVPPNPENISTPPVIVEIIKFQVLVIQNHSMIP